LKSENNQGDAETEGDISIEIAEVGARKETKTEDARLPALPTGFISS
jgi:hypothetical protein